MPSSNARITRRFIVSGRVQGVAYRAWTCEQADSLRIAGWARNRADGSVEVVACGEPAAIATLHALLKRGPPAARVTAVEEGPCDPVEATGFTIG